MITHEVQCGSGEILGCYESFDSANDRAIEHVRGAPCHVSMTATVYRLHQGNKLTVVCYYRRRDEHTGMLQMQADTGHWDIEIRRELGWDTPLSGPRAEDPCTP